MQRRNDWDTYQPAPPRPVRGGIKAQAQRGAFGKSWWAKRWIEVLEGFQLGARLVRGRTYARQGQVLSVTVASGTVTAAVQGSRKRPYQVEIRVRTLTADQWQGLADGLSAQPVFLARLLAGEMPPDIETAFHSAGLSLFPERLTDLHTDCSCPDWSNPCKHIAAVYYLLGEEFDRDPFLIFQLRGMDRDGLVELLSGLAPLDPEAGDGEAGDGGAAAVCSPAEPLPVEPAAFWQGGQLPDESGGEARVPAIHAALPRQLGRFPFWRGPAPLAEMVEPIYARASRRAMGILLGTGDGEPAE